MKLRTLLATLVFVFAPASGAVAGKLFSPPLFAYVGEFFECAVSNITNNPVTVVVRFHRNDGFTVASDPFEIGSGQTQSQWVQITEADNYSYCEVEVVGQGKPARFVRFAWSVFDENWRYEATFGRP